MVQYHPKYGDYRPDRYGTERVYWRVSIFTVFSNLEYGEYVMADGRYPSAVFSNKPFLRFPSTVSGTLELPGGAPSDRVDLRQQLLRTRLWVLRRLRFRVQAWFRGRQRGMCFLSPRGFFSSSVRDRLM